uniref:Uncharacterized protein n=1 Tax=viral metagenome TaxID=1070528 RepID=A0A6H1ZWN0_9ZZZZ
MSFEPAQGRWVNQKKPTKASTTYTVGMMTYNDGTNDVPVTSTTQLNLSGIVLEAKASTSATTSILLRVPSGQDCTFYGDMVSGETLSKANEGAPFDFSSTGLTVSTNSTYDTLRLVKYISSTKGEFAYNLTTGIEN